MIPSSTTANMTQTKKAQNGAKLAKTQDTSAAIAAVTTAFVRTTETPHAPTVHNGSRSPLEHPPGASRWVSGEIHPSGWKILLPPSHDYGKGTR